MSATIFNQIPDVIPLNKKFTRTYFQEDSFVSNIRRVLPRQITKSQYDTLCSSISEEEKTFLQNYYELKIEEFESFYVLKTIPPRISFSTANTLLESAELTNDQMEYLKSFYHFDHSIGKYILNESITEADEIKILQMFKRKDYFIGNVEKTLISDILEKSEIIPKRNVFFANLYIPPTHKFFSPPNLKHISGMQILEAARQFGIAVNHIYGKVPFEDVTFLLLYLNAEFLQYAKINMPIKMRTITKEFKMSKSGHWNYSKLDITVYQENEEIAKIQMAASILPLKVYKRLKNTQEEVYEIDPRFRVLDRFKNNISIRYADNKYVCTIENISLTGFMIKTDSFYPGDLSGKNDLEFFMHFDIAGFIHGKCQLLWVKEDDHNEDCYYAGFKYDTLTPLDLGNVKEAINRFGRLIEDREII
ncbi:MAG: AfsA-related hotdog domain-containing protein [Leptospira sp.]|nr:AfsA-related hotdog domain-containing protein [Leptospira sp.]